MIKRLCRQEQGNIAMFVLGMLVIMILMFTIVANFSKTLVVKEGASGNAEQASFAATAVIYEKVEAAIQEYDLNQLNIRIQELKDKISDWEQQIDLLKQKKSSNGKKTSDQIKKLEDKIAKAKKKIHDLQNGIINPSIQDKIQREEIRISNRHSWTANRVHIAAVDHVLYEECPKRPQLNGKIVAALQNAKDDVAAAVRQSINRNGGTVSGTEITLFDEGRVKVRTSAVFETMEYRDVIPESREDIYQTGRGPTVMFVEKLTSWANDNMTFP